MSPPASIVAIAEEEIVKSVPSPSIFSPSLPKVNPMSEPIFISPPAPTVMDKSVPSDSIFSVPASKSPVFTARATSVVAVKLIVFPVIVNLFHRLQFFHHRYQKLNLY